MIFIPYLKNKMTFLYIAAILFIVVGSVRPPMDYSLQDIDCNEDSIPVQGTCQDIINQQEVEEGGQVFVTCSAPSLRLPYSDVAVLQLYHQGRQDTVARMLASYSVKSPEENFTIASDPIRNWRISRSRRWGRQSESSNTLISRLQLAIYNFTPADVGEYICYSMDSWTRACRCVGTVRMKGIMSTVNKTIMEEGESFTVTCTLDKLNLFPFHIPRYIFALTIFKDKTQLISTVSKYKSHVINERSWKAWIENIGPSEAIGRYIIDDQTLVKLEVTNAQCSDSGKFKCTAYYIVYQENERDIYLKVSTRTDVVVKAPLSEFSFEVFTRNNKPDFVEGETITMMCSVQGPKDVIFDWRFGRKQRNGEMLDYSYQHHRHIKTTATRLSRPGFEDCPYYEHRSQLSFTAERRYSGYTFFCDVLTPGTLFGRRNATIFVQTANASDTEVPHE